MTMINEKTEFNRKLLDWYRAHKRPMPWRDDPSPYRVWVSEIMLQQTQVATVIPYFERFIATIPSVKALSEISDEVLLKLWEGLGYYNRVRNMKLAARQIMEVFDGEIPDRLEALRSLKGIGPYTAGAIRSIAFGKKASAVDGNVYRVMARLSGIEEDIALGKTKRGLEQLAEALLPDGDYSDYTQALIELGALICLPKGSPLCEDCPVSAHCIANHTGKTRVIPFKSPKKKKRIEELTVFVIRFKERYALRRRGASGLLSSMWELPNTEGVLDEVSAGEYIESLCLRPQQVTSLGDDVHVFSHAQWNMTLYYVTTDDCGDDPSLHWVDAHSLRTIYSLPTAFRKVIERELHYALVAEEPSDYTIEGGVNRV